MGDVLILSLKLCRCLVDFNKLKLKWCILDVVWLWNAERWQRLKSLKILQASIFCNAIKYYFGKLSEEIIVIIIVSHPWFIIRILCEVLKNMYIGGVFWKFQFADSREWSLGMCVCVCLSVSVCGKLHNLFWNRSKDQKLANILKSFSVKIHCFRAILCRFHLCQVVVGPLPMRLKSRDLAELLNV